MTRDERSKLGVISTPSCSQFIAIAHSSSAVITRIREEALIVATEAMPDAVPPTDHYQIICSQIPNLTTSQKLDAIEQLTRSIRSITDPILPDCPNLEQRQAAKREVLAFIDELEREAREENQEPISMTDRDHDRLIYGF